MVGRFGQSILAFFTWKAVSAYIKNSMYMDPVTYDTYWVAFMDGQPSFLSVFRITRDFIVKP